MNMSSGEGRGAPVCVTGASGYIASWLVKLLLQRGYTVRASVRDPDDPNKTQHLLAMDGAKERLHLFKAELMDEGCFDSMLEGCQGVFHSASPCVLQCSNPQAELFDPIVNGTLNVLKACAKVCSIRRVVITSSLSSVLYNEKPLTPDVIVDETWFSDPVFCQGPQFSYILAKTLAEEAAWKFGKENGMDIVTLHPGFVTGPFLQPNLNFSIEIILNLINGRTTPISYIGVVDIRDVAFAHVQAFEMPSASGRYCLVERTVNVSQVLKILQELSPAASTEMEISTESMFKVSKERAQSLGISFTPLEVSLKDTIECFMEKGFLPK